MILIYLLTIPGICQMIPDSDWEACTPPPVIECYSITNYWPFNELGELVPFNGQADESPDLTANGYRITGVDQAYTFVAAPVQFVGKQFCTDWLGCVPIHDTFGNITYQSGPFWHSGYNQFVIPIDIFAPDPIHYLECNAQIVD